MRPLNWWLNTPNGSEALRHRNVPRACLAVSITLADALAQQDSMDVEFDPPRVDRLHRATDLS